MPQQNRVTPHGDIVAFERKGQFMGNRGCLHVDHDIVRPWNGKRWITCVLEFRGWVAPQWQPGRWTALFFDDDIEVQMHAYRGRVWARISAQIYNDINDIDRLAEAVVRRVGAATPR